MTDPDTLEEKLDDAYSKFISERFNGGVLSFKAMQYPVEVIESVIRSEIRRALEAVKLERKKQRKYPENDLRHKGYTHGYNRAISDLEAKKKEVLDSL